MTSNVLKLLPCSLSVRRSRGGISNTGWVFDHYPLCPVESRKSTDKHRLFADFYRGDFDYHPLHFLLNVRFLPYLSAFPLLSCTSFLLPMYGTRWVFTPLQSWVFAPSSKLTISTSSSLPLSALLLPLSLLANGRTKHKRSLSLALWGFLHPHRFHQEIPKPLAFFYP